MPKGVPAKNGDLQYKHGRAFIKCINHEVYGTKWVRRSWLVWWKRRKQIVPNGCHLHHKDSDESHDVISNLQLMTRGDHTKLHNRQGDVGSASWTNEVRRKIGEASSVSIKAKLTAGIFGPSSWTSTSRKRASASQIERHCKDREERIDTYFSNRDRLRESLTNFFKKTPTSQDRRSPYQGTGRVVKG
jgi:hypothetical protein